MSEQVLVRLVTTEEDSGVEREAAASVADYNVAEFDKIILSSEGDPVDPSLIDSLPEKDELAEARFVDPVTMTITLTLATLAVRLVNHWMKSSEAGVQIDLRTTPATISRLAGVPLGTLSIIHPDGTTTMHDEAYDDPEDVMGRLTPLLVQA